MPSKSKSQHQLMQLEEVRDAQKSQQGFVRGMVFTVTAVVSAAGFFVNHLYDGGK